MCVCLPESPQPSRTQPSERYCRRSSVKWGEATNAWPTTANGYEKTREAEAYYPAIVRKRERNGTITRRGMVVITPRLLGKRHKYLMIVREKTGIERLR